MEIRQEFLTKNNCFKEGRTITPKGIMIHSIGVAQPKVEVFLRAWNQPGVAACVHAFVHEGGAVQTLPWTHRGWHAGSPHVGGTSANNTHIGLEILEPAGHTYQGGTMVGYDPERNAAYFAAVYGNAVELSADLCAQYGLDPMRDILDHSEGHRRGVASNHADVMQWFPKHAKSMDTFRQDVMAALAERKEQSMTQEEFNNMFAQAMEAYTAEAAARPVSGWAGQAWSEAVARGVFDGSGPAAPLTREQAALVLSRLSAGETK